MAKTSSPFFIAALSTTLLFATAFTASAYAQSSDSAPSVAEAARRAREQKKNAAKPARTLTDDNLPKPAPGEVSVTGTPAAPPADGAATAPGATAAATPANDEKEKQKKAEAAAALENAKKDLAVAEHELNVLQRKQALDDDAYHAKVDYASDTAGKELLDQDGKSIGDKQTAIQAIKDKIAALQAVAGEAPAAAPAPATEPEKNNPPN